jgi:hypothetical protein
MDGWIMFGIMLFVLIAQGALWAWVILERRRKVPDVRIMNMRELVESSRSAIEDYYRSLRSRPRSR